ncbi:hypothetical protein ACWE42_06905 [Sutcliffiella cohnii]
MDKKLLFLLTIFLLLIAVGCGKNSDGISQGQLEREESIVTTNDEEENDNANEEENNEEEKSVEEDDKKGNVNEEEAKAPSLLQLYMPEIGWKKSFTDGEDVILEEEIVATDNEYVQIAYTIGGNVGVSIYKWTENEITLMFEDYNIENTHTNILSSFTPMDNPETIFDLSGNSGWEIIEENATVEVPYGAFENVYVIRKITDEVQDADTIYTRYYAPGYGLIKEIFEVTGEYAYIGETLLESVDK